MKKPSLRLPGREGAPPGLWGSRPQLSLDGDRTLVVEHHQGILDYGPEEVLVAAGGLRIRVKGRDLRLAAMDGDIRRETAAVPCCTCFRLKLA